MPWSMSPCPARLVPLPPLPFPWRPTAPVLAFPLSAVVLLGVGVYSAVTRVGVRWKYGVKMIMIGPDAAAIGFATARLFFAGGA